MKKHLFKEAFREMWRDLKHFMPVLCAIAAALGVLQLVFGTTCPLVIMTGFPCPGCGMTRAFLLSLQLRFREALMLHPLLPVVAVGVVLFLFEKYFYKKDSHFIRKYVIISVILFIGLYIYRMVTMFPEQAPMVYRENNVLHVMSNLFRTIQKN